MHRRTMLAGSAAVVGTMLVPGPLAVPAGAARERTLRLGSNVTRWSQIEQDHHTGGLFPPGVADGAVSFVKSNSGELIVYQMHANGHTYRHVGRTLDTLSPGVWTVGPADSGGSKDYNGISSVLRDPDSNRIYAWTHQEDHSNNTHIASIGQLRSDDGGYTWNNQETIIEGVELQASGFRGAESPSVARDDDQFVMLYGNRHGDGRHQQIHLATADVERDGSPGRWKLRGEVISEDGDPHYHAASPSLRWSTRWRRWVCLYSTDTGYRVRTSRKLTRWSSASTVLTKEQQWTQTSGWWRWYPTILDPSQDDSSIMGSTGRVSEHWVNVENHAERYPAWMSYRT